MISTVTTSTVSSITSAALFGTMGAIATVVLVTLLVQREIASASRDARLLRLQRVLTIAIWPLIIVFALIAVAKVLEILH
jgi:amino acid transporter